MTSAKKSSTLLLIGCILATTCLATLGVAFYLSFRAQHPRLLVVFLVAVTILIGLVWLALFRISTKADWYPFKSSEITPRPPGATPKELKEEWRSLEDRFKNGYDPQAYAMWTKYDDDPRLFWFVVGCGDDLQSKSLLVLSEDAGNLLLRTPYFITHLPEIAREPDAKDRWLSAICKLTQTTMVTNGDAYEHGRHSTSGVIKKLPRVCSLACAQLAAKADFNPWLITEVCSVTFRTRWKSQTGLERGDWYLLVLLNITPQTGPERCIKDAIAEAVGPGVVVSSVSIDDLSRWRTGTDGEMVSCLAGWRTSRLQAGMLYGGWLGFKFADVDAAVFNSAKIIIKLTDAFNNIHEVHIPHPWPQAKTAKEFVVYGE
jgi:hypothetical protein